MTAEISAFLDRYMLSLFRPRKVADLRPARHATCSGRLEPSWYNRNGVERVMEFCSMDQTKRFLEFAPEMEKAIVESGIMLIKLLEMSPEALRQARAFDDTIFGK